MSINGYTSPLAVGHKAAAHLFDGPVVVEEKVDGSQFSFGVDADGVLHARSRGQAINVDAPEGMFTRGIEVIKERASQLTPGWVYRGEYLQRPKHNTLAYERVPAGHVVLFDVDQSWGGQHYLDVVAKRVEALRLGFEPIATLYVGAIESIAQLDALLPTTSQLGGPAEGLVVKNYAHYTPDKKVLMGKVVTASFKEKHKVEWGESNPASKDILLRLGDAYTTEARWLKAVQHLTEAGQLEGTPRDIGKLMQEVPNDVLADSEEDIRDALFKWAWPHVKRAVTRGLPEWYKRRLLEGQFAEAPAEVVAS